MRRRFIIQTAVVFVLFSLEAVLHYCIGKGALTVPDLPDLTQILGVVLFFSVASSAITAWIAGKPIITKEKHGKAA